MSNFAKVAAPKTEENCITLCDDVVEESFTCRWSRRRISELLNLLMSTNERVGHDGSLVRVACD